MASLLIIGGSGFFGKSLLDLFQRGGLAPWGIDAVSVMARRAGRLRDEAPQLLSPAVTLLDADITSTDTLPPADYVIHAAASTDARDYLLQSEAQQKNIIAGTLNYCRLARIHHRASRIVYASSGAVYGNQPADLALLPESFAGTDLASMAEGKRGYARAKRDAEDAILALGRDGIAVGIARCFAFVGPWLPRDQHFAIGNFIGDGLAGRPITVQAQHAVYRSYLHADDLCAWLMAIAAAAAPACPTYNVGSDQALLMGELAGVVAAAFGQQALVPPFSSDRVDRYVPAIDKIRTELGVDIQYDLPAALRLTLAQLRRPDIAPRRPDGAMKERP